MGTATLSTVASANTPQAPNVFRKANQELILRKSFCSGDKR
jgi:hypothetical protein